MILTGCVCREKASTGALVPLRMISIVRCHRTSTRSSPVVLSTVGRPLHGEGEFGSVYRGEWQSPMGCVEVAVKVSKDGLDPSEKVKLLQEAAVMG